MSRSFLIAVDESKEQTARIIEYQNKRNAGEIDPNESQKAIGFIQSIVRNLKYMKSLIRMQHNYIYPKKSTK
ncbi:hypothetical protein [Flavobacterium columnare]|uniref:hypothetical protein n=1 Tax=Flavobacterium columnare TaxID=996 RepID=UPI002989A0E8|nr:hypothetical protein [Flavobacterium columnare]MCH4828218.1 hypothetical protein [Flavobacterium columnare]